MKGMAWNSRNQGQARHARRPRPREKVEGPLQGSPKCHCLAEPPVGSVDMGCLVAPETDEEGDAKQICNDWPNTAQYLPS
jgi:hypothetical protein